MQKRGCVEEDEADQRKEEEELLLIELVSCHSVIMHLILCLTLQEEKEKRDEELKSAKGERKAKDGSKKDSKIPAPSKARRFMRLNLVHRGFSCFVVQGARFHHLACTARTQQVAWNAAAPLEAMPPQPHRPPPHSQAKQNDLQQLNVSEIGFFIFIFTKPSI